MACKLKNEILKDLRDAKVPSSDLKVITNILQALQSMELPQAVLGSRLQTIDEMIEDVDKAEAQTSVVKRDIWDAANGRWVDRNSTVVATWISKTKDGYKLTYKTKTGERVAMLDHNGISTNSRYRVSELEAYYEALRTLKSKEDMKWKANFDSYTQLESDIHGNPEKMIDLMSKLDEMDGNRTDPEHMEHLKELIKGLNPKYLTEMKMYIKEHAKETGGVVTTKAIAITIGKSKNDTQTAAEVYAHEVIHAYTRFATEMARKGDQKARQIMRELEHTMLVAKLGTKWQDLLGKKVDEATQKEIDDAKKMYEYMFDSKYSEDEFLAHVLTNPTVMKKMKRVPMKEDKASTVLDKVKNILDSIVGWVLGEVSLKNRNKSVYDVTAELVARFAELNNRKVNELRSKQNILDRLQDAFEGLDEKTSELLQKAIEKIAPSSELLEKMPSDRIGRAAWYAKFFSKALFHKDYRKVLLTYMDRLGAIKADGTIASIISDLVEEDAVQKATNWLSITSDKIDQNRMNLITTAKSLVRDGFKKALTKEDEELLTQVVLDTDMQSIMNRYQIKDIRRMLADEEVLNTAIGKAKHRLRELDKDNYYWHVNQASGLGYYMATGKAHIVQNMNATNIAKGLLSANRKRPYKKEKGDLVALIDEVATLTALKYTDTSAKKKISELISKEHEGVKNVLSMTKFLKEESERTLFKDQEVFMVKGYSKELLHENIEIEAAPLSKKKEMEDRGYVLVKELDGHSLVDVKEKYGLYKTEMFGMQGWQRTATRLNKQHRKGTSLKDIYYEENEGLAKKKHLINVKKINIAGMKLADSMRKGEVDLMGIEYGLSPVMDTYGEVSTYRYMMPKLEKKDLLKQDTSITEVIGATRGSMIDKAASIEHNDKVLEFLKEDAKNNYIPGQSIGKDGSVYILITDNTLDENIKDLWSMLPKTFKEEAYRNEEKGLPVRKDVINQVFGYRHLSFSNFPGLEKIMPQVVKNAIQIAETIWMEFIKISKVDILIKMPFVLVGNIVSNMVFAINTGTNPIKLLGMYRESLRDVKGFLKIHREWVKLKELEGIGKLSVNDKKKINLFEKQMKNNPVHMLYEKGMYQAIVEDASQEELSATNKLKKWYNEKTSNMPKVIKDGINWAYLTEETQYYKFMTEVLQMSDLVARDIERKKEDVKIEKQLNGGKLPLWYIKHLEESNDDMASSIRLRKDISNRDRKLSVSEKEYFKKLAEEHKWNYLLNAFVNYNKASGPAEEYLNKMGFIMFTKYAKRIQKVVADTGIHYPLRSILILLGDNYLMDIDTVQDQSLFTRSWYNLQPQWPWDKLMDVFTPPILQKTTYQII